MDAIWVIGSLLVLALYFCFWHVKRLRDAEKKIYDLAFELEEAKIQLEVKENVLNEYRQKSMDQIAQRIEEDKKRRLSSEDQMIQDSIGGFGPGGRGFF